MPVCPELVKNVFIAKAKLMKAQSSELNRKCFRIQSTFCRILISKIGVKLRAGESINLLILKSFESIWSILRNLMAIESPIKIYKWHFFVQSAVWNCKTRIIRQLSNLSIVKNSGTNWSNLGLLRLKSQIKIHKI